MQHELFYSKLRPLVEDSSLLETIRSSYSGQNPHRAAAIEMIFDRSIQEHRERIAAGTRKSRKRGRSWKSAVTTEKPAAAEPTITGEEPTAVEPTITEKSAAVKPTSTEEPATAEPTATGVKPATTKPAVTEKPATAKFTSVNYLRQQARPPQQGISAWLRTFPDLDHD